MRRLAALLALCGTAGLACSDVSARLVRHDPDVTRLLDRLEARGFVQRSRDAEDRRVVTARITGDGLRLLLLLQQGTENAPCLGHATVLGDQHIELTFRPGLRQEGRARFDRFLDRCLADLDAAQAALRQVGVQDVAVVGLAKRLEEVWVPGQDHPVVLPRTSESLYLLQRVRDEAHRFANAFHRQRRSRSMTTSQLDGIPGLGKARQQALLARFGSVKALRRDMLTAAGFEVPVEEEKVAALVIASATRRCPRSV